MASMFEVRHDHTRVVPAGHRLRIVVSGNDPRERMSGPTGHALTLLSDAAHPSFVQLPIQPIQPIRPVQPMP